MGDNEVFWAKVLLICCVMGFVFYMFIQHSPERVLSPDNITTQQRMGDCEVIE